MYPCVKKTGPLKLYLSICVISHGNLLVQIAFAPPFIAYDSVDSICSSHHCSASFSTSNAYHRRQSALHLGVAESAVWIDIQRNKR